ncbi:unnamed protein product [Gongylonema pulchrum]|uniref:Uncharacterized protein n=1 Tax=Gongylonema pulchrum TaxID=637853 RepID=A0A3P6R5R1_9BILA|nr:unnamed protein product [Gongylonema pulchrum]
MDRIFAVPSSASELASDIVDRHVFRVLLDSLLASSGTLAGCFATSNRTVAAAASPSTAEQQEEQEEQRHKVSSTGRKYDLQLKADFCAYVIRQVGVVLCCDGPTPRFSMPL